MNSALALTWISVFALGLSSCATRMQVDEAPPWVGGIRAGQESLKVNNGSKILFRRIAGQGSKSSEKACEEAIMRVEKDLKTEFPFFLNIPYSLEVLFYDPSFKDCAVTISVNSKLANKYEELKQIKETYQLKEQELTTEVSKAKKEREEIRSKYGELEEFMKKNAHLLNQAHSLQNKVDRIKSLLTARANVAREYAYVGLRREEFERFINERLSLQADYKGSLCDDYFKAYSFSIHGSIQVCWNNGVIVGYCSGSSCHVKDP